MNVLFVLYHDFTANSASHVQNLANEVAALGASCAVCVPSNLASLSVLVRLRVAFGVASEVDASPAADARLRGALVGVASSSAALREPARERGADSPSTLRAMRLRGAGGFSSSMRESVAGPARRNPAMLGVSRPPPGVMMNGLPSRYLAFLASILVFALAVLGWHHGLGVRLLAILAAQVVTQDGESNWFEGVQLLALYAILAIAFFFA